MVKSRSTRKTSKAARKAGAKNKTWPGLLSSSYESWLGSSVLSTEQSDDAADESIATLVYVGGQANFNKVASDLNSSFFDWQFDLLMKQKKQDIYSLTTELGPLWLLWPHSDEEPEAQDHGGYLEDSFYALARDLMGSFVRRAASLSEFDQLMVCIKGASTDEKLGVLVGLELASYSFQNKKRKKLPRLVFMGINDRLIERAQQIADSVNLARQLVNLPAADLTPKSYADFAKQLFAGSQTTKVTVWDWERLKKEKLSLIMAVGQAAKEKPCIIHLKYRPKSSRAKKPIAFVGKGITFDTGGLNLKPGVGMRNMKKDMGGSASVFGLAHWLEHSGYQASCDLYLAVAENAIGSGAYRPGDILKSRKGKEVEIHNTDAEGRLVLADTIDVALSAQGSDEPSSIINVATLTGAMKIALGPDLFGIFSNNDGLADKLADASYAMGDLSWRMPLFRSYKRMLKSSVADMTNCGSTGYAGSITAALFLEQFVSPKKPWAHLDIFSWTDGPSGPYLEKGATGQAVQCLIGFITGKS